MLTSRIAPRPTGPATFARLLACCALFLFTCGGVFAASNDVLGEVRLKPAGKVEKTAGIWVDGQYLGYLKELKGDKKILLLPGRHKITARLSGHNDFTTEIDIAAGETRTVNVAMSERIGARRADKEDMAKVKLLVKPERAAVFVNDRFVGHVEQYRGLGKSLGLPPGTYRIAIELPGYETFESELTLQKRQRYELKTRLRKGKSEAGRLTRLEASEPPEKVAETR